MGTRRRSPRVSERAGSGPWVGRPGKTKTDVVVRFIRVVPVAVRRAEPPGFVVPGAAPKHAVSVGYCSLMISLREITDKGYRIQHRPG